MCGFMRCGRYSPSGDWTVYLDGSLVAAQSGLTYPTAISRLSNNLGKSNWGSDPYFNGAMRDFRIYGRVLSMTEMAFLYAFTQVIVTTFR